MALTNQDLRATAVGVAGIDFSPGRFTQLTSVAVTHGDELRATQVTSVAVTHGDELRVTQLYSIAVTISRTTTNQTLAATAVGVANMALLRYVTMAAVAVCIATISFSGSIFRLLCEAVAIGVATMTLQRKISHIICPGIAICIPDIDPEGPPIDNTLTGLAGIGALGRPLRNWRERTQSWGRRR